MNAAHKKMNSKLPKKNNCANADNKKDIISRMTITDNIGCSQ
jgi:hypothetical protein